MFVLMDPDVDPELLEIVAEIAAFTPQFDAFSYDWKVYPSKRGWEAEVRAGQVVGPYPLWQAHAQTKEEALQRAVTHAAQHWRDRPPVPRLQQAANGQLNADSEELQHADG